MNPRFYDPFDENALSFVELNKRRRRHSHYFGGEELKGIAESQKEKPQKVRRETSVNLEKFHYPSRGVLQK
jgi:hypothetical protein